VDGLERQKDAQPAQSIVDGEITCDFVPTSGGSKEPCEVISGSPLFSPPPYELTIRVEKQSIV